MIKIGQQNNQIDPRLDQVVNLSNQITSSQQNIISTTKQIIDTIKLLANDQDYGSQNQALLMTMKNKYQDLLESLEGGMNKTAQQVQIPQAPSPDNQQATRLYERLEQLQSVLKGQLSTQTRYMDQASDLVEQADQANQQWSTDFLPQKQNWENTQTYGWELGVSDKRASSKIAYPTMYFDPGVKKPDVDKWKKTAIQMDSFKRVYGKNYTEPQILYHFTKQWDMFERFAFKNWLRWNQKKASSNKMKKHAYDHVTQDRLGQFSKKKKKLLSRIGLVRKALMDLVNNGLIDQQESNRIYKLISMLEFDAMKLSTPKVAAARVKRTANIIEKTSFKEGSSILKLAANELIDDSIPIVKTAEEKTTNQQDAVKILRKIKKEMDSLSYSRHLDALYEIKKDLENMGRPGDSEAIEKIIRDDLSVLEKLNKKLTEVYTNLSKVPLELTEEQDQFGSVPTPEKVIETPLEVTEEEAVSRSQPKKPPQTRPQVTPARQQQAPIPAIQTEGIPNV